jgi:hypothetical protein
MLLSIDQSLVVVLFENGEQTDSIPVIGDSTSVIDMSSHVEHGVPGDALVSGVQEHFQGGVGDAQVGVIELVSNIKSEWTEFTSFLDDGVEESQTEDELVPFLVSGIYLFEEVFIEVDK